MSEELIVWSEELSVGVPEIDEQHRQLVGLLNNLDRAIRGHRGSDVSREMLRALAEYTRVHFATEESLMNVSGYAFYDSHKIKHEDLIRQVVALQEKVDSGETRISFELLHFLKNWLTQHIQGADKMFGTYFVDSIGARSGRASEDDSAKTNNPVSRRWWKFWL